MIKVRAFRGEIPKLHPTLLPDSAAQTCINARMRSGALVPFRAPVTVHTLSANANSFVLIGSAWAGYTATLTDVVPGPVDASRVYLSQDGVAPRVLGISPGTVYDRLLRLPGPSTKPNRALASGSVDPNTKQSIVFAYTYVTDAGEESKPSPLSDAIDWSPGVTISLTGFVAGLGDRGITHRRIYRSVTDFAGVTTLFYVGEQEVSASQFLYDESDQIAEPCPSIDWDEPESTFRSFTSMPNGIIAACSNTRLRFCEPFIPHAWPDKYELTVDYQISGLAALGTSLAVLTTGTPYIVQGSHPDSMVMSRIEQNLPCVSSRGIVDLGYGSAYPSHDGLVLIDNSGARIITAELFSREEWTALNPSSFRASHYEGRYVFSYEPVASTREVGLLDLTGQVPEFIRLKSSAGTALDIIDFYYDIKTSKLYCLASNARTISEFDASSGAKLPMTWRSKRFETGALVNWPWARTDATLGAGETITTKVLGGHLATQIHSYTGVNAPTRLPGDRLDDSFQLEISGTGTVFNVAVGNDPSALGA